MPSFDNAECWEVFTDWADANQELKPRRYTAVHKVWRMDRDYPDIDSPDYTGPDAGEPGFGEHIASLLPPEPTIEEVTFLAPAANIDQILRLLSSFRLPLVPAMVEQGQDGTFFEAQLGGLFGWVRFAWWCEGPPEWQELIRVIGRLLEHLASVAPGD
jgi:hypothetical protein